MRYFRFFTILLAMASIGFSSGVALGDIIDDELTEFGESFEEGDREDLFEVFGEGEAWDGSYEGGGYGGGGGRGNRRCEVIVIIVDRGNNNRRQRHSFFGQGRSWQDARRGAFDRFRGHINNGRFWRNQFNTSFAYRNCG